MDRKLTDFALRYAAAWSSQDAVRLASFYAENSQGHYDDAEYQRQLKFGVPSVTGK